MHLTSFSFSHIFNMYLCHIMGLTADFFSYVLLSQCTCTLRHGYIISLKSNSPSHIILFFIYSQHVSMPYHGLNSWCPLVTVHTETWIHNKSEIKFATFASRESFISKVGNYTDFKSWHLYKTLHKLCFQICKMILLLKTFL